MRDKVVNAGDETSEKERISTSGLLNLFIVYVVWGSTYLAIRVAVRPGAGIPPFTLGLGRLFLAGMVLLILDMTLFGHGLWMAMVILRGRKFNLMSLVFPAGLIG